MEKLKKKLEVIADENEKNKAKMTAKILKEAWTDYGLPNPYNVVKDFIMDKGLKLYGGQALHEHIVLKDGKGLYKKDEFPDYDVFSPDAWNHAKELSNILYNMGYTYVEAKPSVLNDKHHQTYKVSVDFLPMLDLTQVGCPLNETKKNRCGDCGLKERGKCISIFNEIPATNVLDEKDTEIYKETFDISNASGKYKNKFFVTSPEWLKISMYWELTDPMGDSSRLPKVGTRLAKFEKYFQSKYRDICPVQTKEVNVPKNIRKILNFIEQNSRNKQVIEYGQLAHNFYVRDKPIPIINYQFVGPNVEPVAFNLIELLEKKFPNEKFKLETKSLYWKQYLDDEIYISVKNGERYYRLVTYLYSEKCNPYIQYHNMKYAPYDYMVFSYSHRKELPRLYNKIEGHPFDYECLLKELKESFTKNEKRRTKKYKRYVSQCIGEQFDKRFDLMMDRWADKKKTLKKTKYYVDTPKRGYVTKEYPLGKDKVITSYKPSELGLKKYIYPTEKVMKKYAKNLDKLDILYAA